MKENILFSIIVPVYKVEQYLDKCVGSLISQSYPLIEIILVDDGSPDNCPAMCDAYAAKDSRIQVIHKPNGGLSDARNAGLDAATGDYVVFVDSDDYIDLHTFRDFLPFVQMDCDILIGDGVSEGGKSNLFHGYTREICSGKQYLKIALQKGSMPMSACVYLFKRSFLVEHKLRFKFGILHEDEEFTPRTFLAAHRVVDTGVCFYHYVIRENSITTVRNMSKNGRDFYDTCLSLKAIYDTLDDPQLKRLLLDSLVVKYLSLFQTGRLYQYGKSYIHKDFVKENAYFGRTKRKAALYTFSPRLYWNINCLSKRFRRVK